MREADSSRWWRRISLLDYLRQQGWRPAGQSSCEEVAGLCPLHRETRPSFFVNRRKQVFYCHGCGCGGDLIRLIQRWHGLSFPEALARLRPAPIQSPLEESYAFYQSQMARFPEARQYLLQRGVHSQEIMARMQIGYAPGGCLRAHLEGLGHSRAELARDGLIDSQGHDRFWRCVTFPLPEAISLYGRSIETGRNFRHRFLPRSKGGLYGWTRAWRHSSLTLVEGLMDLAVLWQAGFSNAVATLGAHLSHTALSQLGDSAAKTIYVCLDCDLDGTGQRAAALPARQLRAASIDARRVQLPLGQLPRTSLALARPRFGEASVQSFPRRASDSAP